MKTKQNNKSYPQITVRWPQEMRDKVVKQAKDNERTIGAEIRVLLADSLKRKQPQTGERP